MAPFLRARLHEMNMGLQADVGWALVALTMMMACGGSVANVGQDAGDAGKAVGDSAVGADSGPAGRDSGPGVDSGSGVDSGPAQDSGPVISSDAGPPAGPCPPTPPMQATMCSVSLPNLECEYGDDPSPACNMLFQCDPNGSWQDIGTSGACSHTTGMCAATYGAVPVNQACSAEGLWCNYPEGNCYCSSSLPTPGPSWSCVALAPTCPPDRPRIGTACSAPGPNVTCDYGSCIGGAAVLCADGYWQQAPTACPG